MKIVMTVHSTNHNGGNGQHPSQSSFHANADFTETPLIAGFEWNIRHEVGQVNVVMIKFEQFLSVVIKIIILDRSDLVDDLV